MKEVFPIVSASNGPIWLFVGISAFLLAMVALFGWLAWSSRSASVEVSADGLRVSGVMYGRTIKLSSLRLDDARSIQIDSGDHKLVVRTNGAGLPGFLAGWFRSAKGEKILAFVTDKRRVAYLPTSDGYSLMVSVADPLALIDSVRSAARR